VTDSTIIITSSDLAEHASLSRKKIETLFRRDYLLRNGATPQDPHVTALDTLIKEIGQKLLPLEEKLDHIDLITIMPSRSDILRLTEEINHSTREGLDEAIKTKRGYTYELLRQRATLTKSNFERREDIARLTVLANTLPRNSAEGLRALVENNSQDEVDVSSFAPDRQQDLVNLLGRISQAAFVYEGKLSLDKKKVDGLAFLSWSGEVKRLLQSGHEVWIPAHCQKDWDENEKILKEISNRIIAKTHEKQVRVFSDDEQAEFDKLQRGYLAAKDKRMQLLPTLTDEKAELARVEHKSRREELAQIDI